MPTRLDQLFRAESEEELERVLYDPDVDLVLYCPRAVGVAGYFTQRQPAPLPGWLEVVHGPRDGDGPVLVRVAR